MNEPIRGTSPNPLAIGDDDHPLGRRQFLWRVGGGFGGAALAQMLGVNGVLADNAKPRPEFNGGLHHRAKVRRVIQLFMNGGASQCDTFDYKPELIKRHGQKFDPGAHVEAATSVPGNVLKSPWSWKQYGQTGRWVSSVFPYVSQIVDDLAFLMSMSSKTNVHGPGSYLQNTGFVTPGFPCMGAWISYGLGSLNDNLPTFVVLPDPRGLPYNNAGNFTSAFLPVEHQGTIIKPNAPVPIADLFPPKSAKYITREAEDEGQALLRRLNRDHMERWQGDSRLEARLESYEMAARMQLSAPEVLDISHESEATRRLYGLDAKETETFGKSCLTARRLLERGVRFVQVWSGPGGAKGNWDNHADVGKDLAEIAHSTDKPVAGLVRDLKSRGLFDDTLVIWTTEFGRMPFSQGSLGRDHNGGTFVTWLVGAGVKEGIAIGESDEWSWKSRSSITGYDLHATILHLMGIDHERLTFRHNGANRRLTDVHGHVLSEILT
jgi:hypothetical protein